MKCSKCGGNLNYVEEVSGSFVSEVDEFGEIMDSEYYGDSWNFLECEKCNHRPAYNFNNEGKIVLMEEFKLKNTKRIFLLIGPSGSGKDTLGEHLKSKGIPELVSHTTRKMREGEIDGVNYHFITKEKFNKIERIEESNYSGNFYALSKSEVDSKLKEFNSVFAIVDINGYEQIKEKYPEETVSIYIEVTLDEMAYRMRQRGDKKEDIAKRISNAILTDELSNGKECDYIIRNEDGLFNLSKEALDKIIILESVY